MSDLALFLLLVVVVTCSYVSGCNEGKQHGICCAAHDMKPAQDTHEAWASLMKTCGARWKACD